jgi:hypothetical protein
MFWHTPLLILKRLVKRTKMQEFNFSQNNINRLKTLNIKSQKEEQRVKIFAEQLRNSLNKQKNDHIIDDFNFRSSIHFSSDNMDYNQRHSIDLAEGKPFLEFPAALFSDRTSSTFYEYNWNKLWASDHPLANEYFCYTMHLLCFDGRLSWQDIVDINTIWIELKVDYQFFVNMPGV